ncbi:hypothetical protein LINPERPRIM_LOCUS36375 [Linum perenne]
MRRVAMSVPFVLILGTVLLRERS